MRFATDATLGKLGRHLRAAGFDTVRQHECQSEDFFDRVAVDRIILTRTSRYRVRYKQRQLLFVRDNDPREQFRQVIKDLKIGPGDINPFSRCLVCNLEIKPIDKEGLKGKIPAYIWQRHQTFCVCSRCQRIYWAGTHHQRLTRCFEKIFNHKGCIVP